MFVFLSTESISYLADESEEPRKILSSAIKCCVKFNCCLMILILLSFFPFIYRMGAFEYNQPIPIVFNSIGIFSARFIFLNFFFYNKTFAEKERREKARKRRVFF